MFDAVFHRIASDCTTVTLVLENELREICEAAKEVKKSTVDVPRPRQRVVESYKNYLEKRLEIPVMGWEKIQDLIKIRNCIVHASGKVTGSKYQDHLEQLTKSNAFFFISGYNHAYDEDIQPLYF
jgi:hypothetical protein